ncbi:unnamed protein product, partial [Staurois parvus]
LLQIRAPLPNPVLATPDPCPVTQSGTRYSRSVPRYPIRYSLSPDPCPVTQSGTRYSRSVPRYPIRYSLLQIRAPLPNPVLDTPDPCPVTPQS